MQPTRPSPLLKNQSNKNGGEHQKDAIVPHVLLCYDQLNSQHILETSQTCCEKCHGDEKDQKILLCGAHLSREEKMRDRTSARDPAQTAGTAEEEGPAEAG